MAAQAIYPAIGIRFLIFLIDFSLKGRQAPPTVLIGHILTEYVLYSAEYTEIKLKIQFKM